jgi:hypothetical protein
VDTGFIDKLGDPGVRNTAVFANTLDVNTVARARTAGSDDVRVSVRATKETLLDFARAKRPAVWRRAA